MALRKTKIGILFIFIASLGAGFVTYSKFNPYRKAVMTIHKLLTENNELKQAITNLTEEDQIGYAKIISQEEKDGSVFTTIKFVETARNDHLNKILEKEFTVEGDIFYFDMMIVKFQNKMVTDGKAKALYIWRRIFGEKMAPEDGYIIEEPGTEPLRYKDLLEALPAEHCELFWTNIWDLANDPNKLQEYGIQAIYGDAVYYKLIKDRIYIFKITSTGQFYLEAIPDI